MVYRKKPKPVQAFASGDPNRGLQESGLTSGGGLEMPEYLVDTSPEEVAKQEEILAEASADKGNTDSGVRQVEDMTKAKAQISGGAPDANTDKVIKSQVTATQHKTQDISKTTEAEMKKRGSYQKHTVPIEEVMAFQSKIHDLEMKVSNYEKWVQGYEERKKLKNMVKTEISKLGLKQKVDVEEIKKEDKTDSQAATKQQAVAPQYTHVIPTAPVNYMAMLGGKRTSRY